MYVINVLNPDNSLLAQVHCLGRAPVKSDGVSIHFSDGSSCNLEKRTITVSNGSIYFVNEDEQGFVAVGAEPAAYMSIVTITHDGTMTIRRIGGTTVIATGDKHHVHLGKVDPNSGVQIGSGNVQVNNF